MTAKEEETERGGESNGGGEGETEREVCGEIQRLCKSEQSAAQTPYCIFIAL